MTIMDFKTLRDIFSQCDYIHYIRNTKKNEKKNIYSFDYGYINFSYEKGKDYVVARGKLEENASNKREKISGFYQGIENDLYGIYPQNKSANDKNSEIEYIIYTRAGFIWALLAVQSHIEHGDNPDYEEIERRFKAINGKIIEKNVRDAQEKGMFSIARESMSPNLELKELLDLFSSNITVYVSQEPSSIDYTAYPSTLHIGFSQAETTDTSKSLRCFEIADLRAKSAMRYIRGKDEVRYVSEYNREDVVIQFEHVFISNDVNKELIIIKRKRVDGQGIDEIVYDVISRKIIKPSVQNRLYDSRGVSESDEFEKHIIGLIKDHIASTNNILSQCLAVSSRVPRIKR